MARTWLEVRVDLLSGRDIVCDPRPGRVFLVGPRHTFAALSQAIDDAFARWDQGHLHLFELADGRHIGSPDDDFPYAVHDHEQLKVASEVGPGDEFAYTFDLGDDWRHHCRVLPEKIDTQEIGSPLPTQPVPVLGWGWIPDQYGRESPDEDELA